MINRIPYNDTSDKTFVFSVSANALTRTIRRRLTLDGNDGVIWVDGDSEVIVYPSQLRLILRPGWVLVELTMESDQTGQDTITIPLAIGENASTASLGAVTETATRGNALLSARWGRIAQDIIWSAILNAGRDVLSARNRTDLQLVGVYTDGDNMAYLTAFPVDAGQIATYFETINTIDDLPPFDPQPIDLFPDAVPEIDNLVLVDADAREPIEGYDDMRGNVTLDLARLPSRLSIRADATEQGIGSVKFEITGADGYQVENDAPYFLVGNREDTIFAWEPSPGRYVLTVTAYTEANATGDAGIPAIVRLNIIRTPDMQITHFVLVDAEQDRPIEGFDPIPPNATINLAELPTRQLNIVAHTTPDQVGSVVFGLNGNPQHQIEDIAPYTLFGNEGPDYRPWTPAIRTYHLSATPYSEASGTGVAGKIATLDFRVIDTNTTVVMSLTLIDAGRDQPIPQFDPIRDGATIDLSTLSGRNLTIRANTYPEKIGSVRFGLNKNPKFKIENFVPYALFGNEEQDYFGKAFEQDYYVITATPYSEANAHGEEGQALTVHFTVLDDTPALAVISFSLIDANSGEPLSQYDPIPDGVHIRRKEIAGKHLTIRANISGETPASVIFDIGKREQFAITNDDPFLMIDGKGRQFTPGTYQIQATPYLEPNGKGTAGIGAKIKFLVVP